MPSYPANKINTPDEQINILQITDLHLSTPVTADDSSSMYSDGMVCQRSFESILQQALSKDIRCDLIIVTGDLVSQVTSTIYDHIFDVLQATHIPFACIAGNHDVTDESGKDLPFSQRKLIARPADSRLLSRHVIETEYWQLLLLDSSITGKIAGEITPTDIDWLCKRLSRCKKPALIALHHHIIPLDSDWIDTHMAKNTERFWEHMLPFEHLKVVISGHTHQEQVRQRQGVTVYSTPSTCYQFKPYEYDFAYDESALPGYRWLQLANNGTVASWVERLDT
ncbi:MULTISPECIES: metallophosphoesterase [unclassified Psychrobacter]|uniref:metallophosphoesterase n=1 Tax=unclassified Psychrobacter TaxID=196806 RepID=UPI0025B3D171|nr:MULTISPECIES: metallophosphoesterase [unclassified Psychrobacter]MDN3453429.1 metallophosphoesterase [Psychrobacter sp. APC 3350]MDN3501815.1 metallophosphoesterase [Psychrobacter sp. 5A.1]